MSGHAPSGTGSSGHGLPAPELAAPQPHRQGAPPRRRAVCRYFGQPSGCRSGAACSFRHEESSSPAQHHQQATAAMQQPPARASGPSSRPLPSVNGELDPVVPPAASTPETGPISQRPVPSTQLADPRQYQLSQLRRRFSPQERDENSTTVLSFRLRPSDPDFPFEMEALQCVLRIPLNYPTGAPPSLTVTNPDMERGYQINIERGFDKIVANSPSATLLTHLNKLDRQLEELLSLPKADTIKIVSHPQKPDMTRPLTQVVEEHKLEEPAATSAYTPPKSQTLPTPEQLSVARQVRETEVRQLEARMGRLPQFSKSKDGISYTLPIEPRKRTELPIGLQAIKLVKLIVPETYNLQPCRIELLGVEKDAASGVEQAFLQYSQDTKISLFSRMNHLSQNMHTMAAQVTRSATSKDDSPVKTPAALTENKETRSVEHAAPKGLVSQELDRPHVITIPRPPEWTSDPQDEESSDSSEDEDDEEDTLSVDEAVKEGQAQPTSLTESSSGRRIAISFPHLELHGIELLEIASLNITVKCECCKTPKDISKLQSTTKGGQTRQDYCNKCGITLVIEFKAELLHANSIQAAHLNLDGCTVVDLLPSSFVPTCRECSTSYPQTGVTAVRGDTSMAFCRECHKKMTFRIPEVKFLRVGPSGALPLRQTQPRNKKPEKLGIVAGQELPDRGRCSHYRKSYRWFRFSCCSKVFPCDRCHEETADHPIEQANRMICGFCSREQNFRPKDCGICHAWLTVRPGKGFWEGGMGTRDQRKMSRKDPRKYKRKPGSKVGS